MLSARSGSTFDFTIVFLILTETTIIVKDSEFRIQGGSKGRIGYNISNYIFISVFSRDNNCQDKFSFSANHMWQLYVKFSISWFDDAALM